MAVQTVKDLQLAIDRIREKVAAGHGLDSAASKETALLLESLGEFVDSYAEDHGELRDTVDDRVQRLVRCLFSQMELQRMADATPLPWDEPPECLGETQGA